MRYTTILHEIRLSLDLTANEYIVCDAIYFHSNSPKSIVPYWCTTSKASIGKPLGFSRESISKIIGKLESLGLVERNQLDHVRTTDKWNGLVYPIECEESSHTVKNVHAPLRKFTHCEESSHTVKNVHTNFEETHKEPYQMIVDNLDDELLRKFTPCEESSQVGVKKVHTTLYISNNKENNNILINNNSENENFESVQQCVTNHHTLEANPQKSNVNVAVHPSTKTGKKAKKIAVVFAESEIADIESFVKKFAGTDYEVADLNYYFMAVRDWRKDGEVPTKIDWVATARNFMLNDFKAGKLITKNQTQQNGKSTNGKGPGEYANAAEPTFEQMFNAYYGN